MARRSARRGGSAIEFALTMPVFVAFLAVMVDYGWVFFQQANLDNTVHRGCRQGAVTDPVRADPEVVARTRMEADLERLNVACGAGCVINIETRGVYPAISMFCDIRAPYTGLFGLVPTPDFINASTLMRYEWQDDMIAGGT